MSNQNKRNKLQTKTKTVMNQLLLMLNLSQFKLTHHLIQIKDLLPKSLIFLEIHIFRDKKKVKCLITWYQNRPRNKISKNMNKNRVKLTPKKKSKFHTMIQIYPIKSSKLNKYSQQQQPLTSPIKLLLYFNKMMLKSGRMILQQETRNNRRRSK